MSTNPEIRAINQRARADRNDARAQSNEALAGIEREATVIESDNGGTFTVDASGTVTITLSNGQTITGQIPQLATQARMLLQLAQENRKLRQQTAAGFRKTKEVFQKQAQWAQKVEDRLDEWQDKLTEWLDQFHDEAAGYRDQGMALFETFSTMLNAYIEVVNVADAPQIPSLLGLARAVEQLTLTTPGQRRAPLALMPGWGSGVRMLATAAKAAAYYVPSIGLSSIITANNNGAGNAPFPGITGNPGVA